MLGIVPVRAEPSTVDATSPARPDNASASASHDVAAEPDVLLEPGARAGDFVIEELLGHGSFGTVYRASHGVIGRRAAVKVLRSSAGHARAIESFIEEARLVARLRHAHIVDVLTFGQLDDGRHFQVMDLIDGPTLADHLRDKGALSLTEALPILRGIASALDAVHDAGVVHRDLKPANVMLEKRGAQTVPKLIDFGVAELIAPEGTGGAPSARGALRGTPRYMAPEQCRGNAVDARADAYAFGLLAYEMLAGRHPFDGGDALALMLKHTDEAPSPPSSARPALSPAIDRVVLALLAKRPEDRPAALTPVVDELAALASPEAGPAPSRSGRIAVTVAVALIAAGAWYALSRDEPAPAAAPVPSPEPIATPEATPETKAVATTSAIAAPSASASAASRGAPPPAASRPAAPPKPAPDPEDSENPFRK